MSKRTDRRDKRRRALWQPRELEARFDLALLAAIAFDKARRNIWHLRVRDREAQWQALDQVLARFIADKLDGAAGVRVPGRQQGVSRRFDTARLAIRRVDNAVDREQLWRDLAARIDEFNTRFDTTTRRRRVVAA